MALIQEMEYDAPIMRCLFTCTAERYLIPSLYTALKERYEASLDKNVISIEIPTQFDMGNVFIFSYGCIVCWGLTREQEAEIIKDLKPYEVEPEETPSEDVFTYISGDTSKIVNGEIVLASRSYLNILALSHGLAQSVKLDSFERRIAKTVASTRQIPIDLAKFGKIGLSRKEIRRKMGELFLERSSINLHTDVLDTPEFFWEYPEVEPLYHMIAHYLDLETRVEVLNQRLGVIHELFNMLNNEMNHQQASRLEMTIILLILIEVGFLFMKDVFGLL